MKLLFSTFILLIKVFSKNLTKFALIMKGIFNIPLFVEAKNLKYTSAMPINNNSTSTFDSPGFNRFFRFFDKHDGGYDQTGYRSLFFPPWQ